MNFENVPLIIALIKALVKSGANYPMMPQNAFISRGTLDTVLSTPSIMPALSDEEKKAAQIRIGILSSEEVLF